ncbi:exonuclease [Enterococcus phage vB_Efs8_KEN04]|uniref:Exonuclease n=1 Tax=Enterococcus phage vB_Efs6_KEN16 TaxID=3138325 RepID=A0AAX4PS09_9CAUD
MLKFKRVSAENYMSIGSVSIDLDNQGLVLIEGINDTNETFQSNGSGKSTLLSTVTYALYGATPSGLKADAVINKQAKKNMSVILEFEKDGVPYRIERYRKHSKHKNTTRFFQGTNDITQKSVADTDKKIQDVFGIDYLTYANSIMYGQGNVEIFATATDKGKKQILENLADIGVYRYAQDVAKERAQKALALAEELNRQYIAKTYEKDGLTQSYNSALQQYENTEKLIQQKESELANAKLAIKQSEKNLSEGRALREPELEKLREQMAQLTSPADVREIDVEVETQYSNVSRLSSAKTQNDTAIEKLKKELEDVKTNTNCYLCGALLSPQHREQEIQRIQREIADKEAFIEKLNSALAVYSPLLEQARAKQEEARKAIQEHTNIYHKLNGEMNALYHEIDTLENTLNTSINNRDSIKDMLTRLQEIPKPQYDYDKDREIEDELNKINQLKLDAEEEASQYKTIAQEIFSNKGIRSEVLDLVTPFLNERANHYLSTLSGSDIEINFSTQTEKADGSLADKFDLEVVNGSGGNTYQANSEGEKKRIDLAISFAIQDLVQSKANIAVNLGLYDECFDGLDAIGCENVIKILKERQKNISSIFVITHSENLKPLFENVITMKKVQGRSYLEESK